jgi:hypothetical protein
VKMREGGLSIDEIVLSQLDLHIAPAMKKD